MANNKQQTCASIILFTEPDDEDDEDYDHNEHDYILQAVKEREMGALDIGVNIITF